MALPDAGTVVDRAVRGAAGRFGRAPTHAAVAPGRVNLVGEHTDYNDGLVLPMTIDRWTAIAGGRSGRRDVVRVGSAAFDAVVELPAPGHGAPPAGAPPWTRPVRGVLALAAATGRRVGGLEAWIESDVPVGAGLASSAALTVALATLVETLTGAPFAPREKVSLCRAAEHFEDGVPCGVMDPFVIEHGRAGNALCLDCRTLESTAVPIDDRAVRVLLVDSGHRRTLADGAYARRRDECIAAAAALGVPTLREATAAMLDEAGMRLAPVLARRARHVIGEVHRVAETVAAARRGDWPAAGRHLGASHDALRDDFEVSTRQLDAIVDAARGLGPPGGVHGARMTGAGFGGWVVALVDAARAEWVAEAIAARAAPALGAAPRRMFVRPVNGAAAVILP